MRDFNKCWYEEVCDDKCTGCQSSCEQYQEMKYLMEHSGLPKSKQQAINLYPQECDLQAYKRLKEIKDNIVDFVDSGSNLYICSTYCGNGKTSWAIKLLQSYFNNVWDEQDIYVIRYNFKVRGLFIHVPTFLSKCKEFKSNDLEFEELKNLIPKVDLIVWDEIAANDLSNYDYNQLLRFIDARSLDEKANIFTGFVTSYGEMDKILGSRLTSRIWNNRTEVIEFMGDTRR